MTEETQIDPPWKAALDKSILAALKAARMDEDLTDAVLAAVLPHMETSYRTGRMAGASASAKRLAQKNLEQAKKLREVREHAEYHSTECTGWCCGHEPKLLAILDAES